MRRRVLAGLLATALVALPLACGDDDEDSGLLAGGDTTEETSDDTEAPPDDTEVEETEPNDTEVDDTEVEETEPDDTGVDDTEADPGDVSGGDLARWCEISAELDEIDPFETSDEPDPATLEEAYDEMDSHIDEYVEVSPDEIRDDAEAVTTSFREIRELLESHDYDFQATIADPMFAEIVTEDFDAASDRLDEFEEANCS